MPLAQGPGKKREHSCQIRALNYETFCGKPDSLPTIAFRQFVAVIKYLIQFSTSLTPTSCSPIHAPFPNKLKLPTECGCKHVCVLSCGRRAVEKRMECTVLSIWCHFVILDGHGVWLIWFSSALINFIKWAMRQDSRNCNQEPEWHWILTSLVLCQFDNPNAETCFFFLFKWWRWIGK